MMPGGRPARPGPPRNPALLAARPNGLAKLSWAAAAEEAAGVRTGEVGRESGELDWTIRGDWREGDKICGEPPPSPRRMGDPS